MECDRVKELLNDYIDGTIDAQQKQLVEEHLSVCGDCAQEFNSLKAYLEAVSSLEKTDAPENFLRSVNEKLENESPKLQEKPVSEPEPKVKDIKQNIFMPFKFKLSLQALGALAAVLFVVFLIKAIKPSGELSIVDSLPKLKEEKAKVVADKFSAGDEKKPPSMTTQKESEIALTIPKSKPVEIVLLIKPEAEINASVRNGKPISEPTETLRSRTVTAEKGVSLYFDSSTSPVEELIISLGGNILSVKYGEPETLLISAEISKERYSDLLKNLDRLDEFQKPLPVFIGADGDFLKIRIKLTPSD